MLKIVGYPDRYSVAPGEKIAFKISLEEGTHFDARLVRVIRHCMPPRELARDLSGDGLHLGGPLMLGESQREQAAAA